MLRQRGAGGSALLPSLCALLLVICATNVFAQADRVDQIVQRLVGEIYELRSGDRRAEESLVSRGLSSQDADLIVHGFVNGVVRCLFDQLQSYSAENAESFSETLLEIEKSLEVSGAKAVLDDVASVVMAHDEASVEGCLLGELQKAGITPDVVDTLALGPPQPSAAQ